MKVHNDLNELLEAHTKWVLKFYTLSNGKYDEDLERAFIASNSLALGKPEPLAKNKHTIQLCNCNSIKVDEFRNGVNWRTCPECGVSKIA